MAFKQGHSGNPEGRPKGLNDKRTALRALLEPHAGALVRKAIALAKEGEPTALRLCLERLIPTIRPIDRPIEIAFPEGGFKVRGEAIIGAIAAGTLTPSEGESLMKTLTAQVRLVEAEDLESRLAEVEIRLGLAKLER